MNLSSKAKTNLLIAGVILFIILLCISILTAISFFKDPFAYVAQQLGEDAQCTCIYSNDGEFTTLEFNAEGFIDKPAPAQQIKDYPLF